VFEKSVRGWSHSFFCFQDPNLILIAVFDRFLCPSSSCSRRVLLSSAFCSNDDDEDDDEDFHPNPMIFQTIQLRRWEWKRFFEFVNEFVKKMK